MIVKMTTEIAALRAALRTVRMRIRLDRGFAVAMRGAMVDCVLTLVVLALYRSHLLGVTAFRAALIFSWTAVAVATAVRSLRNLSDELAAKQIDRSHALHDRFGSALEFAQVTQPTPFQVAHLRDTAHRLAEIDLKRAAPIHTPAGWRKLGALAVGIAILTLVKFPSRASRSPVRSPEITAPRLTVDADAIADERENVRKLAREARDSGDQKSSDLATDLNRLLEQIGAEELTRKEAFDRLDALEKRLAPERSQKSFDTVRDRLKQVGKELEREKITRAAGEAMASEDLAKAKEELRKLAEQAEKLAAEQNERDQKLSPEEREKAARSLDRAAKAPNEKSAEEKQREAEEKQLRDEERKLKRELAEKPNDEETQRKLKRNQRELERLEREKQAQAEQHRQLERLKRDLEKAAEQLRQKLSPEALRQLSEQMGEMQNEIRKLGSANQMKLELAEIKEMLRRMGKNQQLQNGSAQAQDQPGGRGNRMKEFNQRAGGGKANTLIFGGGGKSSLLLPLPGNGNSPGGKGDQNPGGGAGQGDHPGDGIGDQHDPNLLGDRTDLKGHRYDTRVQGNEGAGPSRSETILGSAERGFASRSYKKVYTDYSSIVEEVMSNERVPPGYRYYIKRYFQLIKPRE